MKSIIKEKQVKKVEEKFPKLMQYTDTKEVLLVIGKEGVQKNPGYFGVCVYIADNDSGLFVGETRITADKLNGVFSAYNLVDFEGEITFTN